jgi:hypothetical protein
MSPGLQMTLLFAFACLCVATLWRARWQRVAIAAVDADRQEPPPKQPEDSGDEQLPETDRAPRSVSHLLTYAVALTAAVRLGVLVAFQR